jgi:hypothetical protein
MFNGGEIKAAKRGEPEHQEGGHGRKTQTDPQTVAEEDADRARKASG